MAEKKKKYDKVGAPTKYEPDFHPEQIKKMARMGKNVTQMCASLSISKPTYYLWVKTHPVFSNAHMIAKELTRAWYFNDAQANLSNRNYNSMLWSYLVQSLGINTRNRTVVIDTLKGAKGKSLSDNSRDILAAMAEGELTPEEASNLITGVNRIAAIDENTKMKEQIEELEKKLGKKK